MTTTGAEPGLGQANPLPIETVLDLEMLQASPGVGDPPSLMQLRVLWSLSDIVTQSPGALGRRLGVQRAALEAVFPPLVERGWIIRIPRGAIDTSPTIVLSTAGRRFVNDLRARSAER